MIYKDDSGNMNFTYEKAKAFRLVLKLKSVSDYCGFSWPVYSSVNFFQILVPESGGWEIVHNNISTLREVLSQVLWGSPYCDHGWSSVSIHNAYLFPQYHITNVLQELLSPGITILWLITNITEKMFCSLYKWSRISSTEETACNHQHNTKHKQQWLSLFFLSLKNMMMSVVLPFL